MKIFEIIKKTLKKDDTNIYWINRAKFLNSTGVIKVYLYLKCKKIEKRNNSELGIQYNGNCAFFKEPPRLPHGLNGIIISHKACIGKNVTIMHRVTIGTKIIKEKVLVDLKAPTIGDNVYIGTGAIIIGDIVIGNNAIIGANAVVTKNVPSGYTAVGVPAQMRPNNSIYI